MSGMKPIPLSDAGGLLASLSMKYAALAAIGITTGCRVSEILGLRRFDLLDRKGRLRDVIRFTKLKTKTGEKYRELEIPPRFRPYIFQHLVSEEMRGYDRPDEWVFRGKRGEHLDRHTVYRYFFRKLGAGYGTHWMRKTFAAEMYRYYLQATGDGLNAARLTQEALGHARLETTIHYLGLRANRVREAQKVVFG